MDNIKQTLLKNTGWAITIRKYRRNRTDALVDTISKECHDQQQQDDTCRNKDKHKKTIPKNKGPDFLWKGS